MRRLVRLLPLGSILVGLFIMLSAAGLNAQNIATIPMRPTYSGKDLTHAIDHEEQVSLKLMLKNISRPGTAIGSVVASPSKLNPNYYYNWIRDSALTMAVIEKLYRQNGPNHAYWGKLLKNYVRFSRRNQLTPNPSGAADGGGLGEPKFNVNGTAFTGAWGRPQNDGPALRAITLIAFARDLIREGQLRYVHKWLYDGRLPSQSVIKVDLEYVAHHWSGKCFDLWEEIRGHHFFTLVVSRRAMVEGAQLAQELGDPGAAKYYRQQAAAIALYLQKFWSPKQGFLRETIDGGGNRSGLDTAVILGVLHGATPDRYLAANNNWVMATAARLIEAFSHLYRINRLHPNSAPAIGRYPEDVYNGVNDSRGNPWFLTTLAMAQYCFTVRNEFAKSKAIDVTKLNAPFLQMALSAAGVNDERLHYGFANVRLYNALEIGLARLGDKFFNTVLQFEGANGSLSEEFNRDTGAMQGARDLTWSFAAFITATWARRQTALFTGTPEYP